MRPVNGRSAQRGVTLLELMAVVVIVAILAAIAVPTYRQQMLRSNRSSAKTMLTETAQNLERCYTRTSTFVGCVVFPVTRPEGLYIVTGAINPTTYLLTATPQGGQARDTACGNLTLDQANARLATGSSPDNECWSR